MSKKYTVTVETDEEGMNSLRSMELAAELGFVGEVVEGTFEEEKKVVYVRLEVDEDYECDVLHEDLCLGVYENNRTSLCNLENKIFNVEDVIEEITFIEQLKNELMDSVITGVDLFLEAQFS